VDPNKPWDRKVLKNTTGTHGLIAETGQKKTKGKGSVLSLSKRRGKTTRLLDGGYATERKRNKKSIGKQAMSEKKNIGQRNHKILGISRIRKDPPPHRKRKENKNKKRKKKKKTKTPRKKKKPTKTKTPSGKG